MRVVWNLVWLLLVAGGAAAQTTELVSVSSAGEPARRNNDTGYPTISADGRYVAFRSGAANLVPGDTNGLCDVFLRDRQTGQTTRISVTASGDEVHGHSAGRSDISADGRYVAFGNGADDIVPDDSDGLWDVFVRDRVAPDTIHVSVSSAGDDANGSSMRPSMSADGRYVAFDAEADNLVPGDVNGVRDVFVHDCVTGETTLVSLASWGDHGNDHSDYPSISADGRYVAFASYASNLILNDAGCCDIFLHDRVTGETKRISQTRFGQGGNDDSYFPCISADGRYVAFGSKASNLVPGDVNGFTDVFVYDRVTRAMTMVSVSSVGEQGNGRSDVPSISADGRFVAFYSEADNLVPGDTNGVGDIFVHDMLTGETARVSVSWCGEQGNGTSEMPSINADGRFVAFRSMADNLVPSSYPRWQIFVRDRAELHDASRPLPAGWSLISVPVIPEEAAARSVLNRVVMAGNDLVNNLFAYDGSYSVYSSDFATLETGRGYWIRLDVPAEESVCGPQSDSPIALLDGWSLIGHPRCTPVLFASCQLSDGVEVKTVPEAIAAGWIDGTAYYYEGGSYKTLRCDGTGDDDALRPWYGYWLFACRAGLELIVP